MYHFAVMVLLALGALKITDFLTSMIPVFERIHSLLTIGAATGAVWLLDYSLFEGFNISVRNHGSGVWMTAAMVAGLTVPWRATFRLLTHDRAKSDETLGEESTPLLRRVS